MRVNMSKTMVMISGERQKVMQKAVRWPCGVCGRGVGVDGDADAPPPSNTPIPQLTPLTTPNGIQIQLAVLPQYTFRTDRWSRRQAHTMSAPLTMLIESDTLVIDPQYF